MVNGVRVRKLMQVHMRASQIALYTTRNNDRRAVPLKRGCLTACAAFVCEFSNGLETQSFVIDIGEMAVLEFHNTSRHKLKCAVAVAS